MKAADRVISSLQLKEIVHELQQLEVAISKVGTLAREQGTNLETFQQLNPKCMTIHGLAVESLIPVLGKYIQEGVIKIVS